MSHGETTLATLSGSRETERVVLVLVAKTNGSVVELRQQSWGEGVGWFTQSNVQLEPQQVAELKQTLGQAPHASTRRSSRKPTPGGFIPRVVHAESA
jgi:hypothetical protein